MADVDATDRLPAGTITFLFSDIEGSTELAAALGPSAYGLILEQHQRLLRDAFAQNGGVERGTEGDSFFVVFRDAPSAVAAAVSAQRSLAAHPWPSGGPVLVRMGLHTGQGVLGGDDYVGIDVNRAARIAAAAHGGQVLISDPTRSLTTGSLPDGVEVRDVGRHRLKGIPDREHIFQLTIADLPFDFPPIRSLDASLTNLPARVSSFVGREREIDEISALIGDGRLVTLIGPGGTGKTSLATEVARRIGSRFQDGVWFVALDAITDPELIGSAVVAGLGLQDISGRSARDRLLDNLPGRSLLLVLDNFEQVLDAATLVNELLVAAFDLRAIITSRAPLQLSTEQLYPVAPLEVPEAIDGIDPVELGSIPSVRLFVDRARRVQPGFVLTTGNAQTVAEICRRLDGLPLGIELAAARIAMLGPAGIRDRLERQVPLGGSGARDSPTRQRTLEDTIAWSHGLLDDPGRSLFARLGVFAGGWRLEEAEAICGPAAELGGDVEDILAELIDQSLVTTATRDDAVRFGMLETVRRHAAAWLAQDDDREEILRRHARTFLALAEATTPAIETRDGATAIARLAEERENLRCAVRLAIETCDAELGLRLARVLGRFWSAAGDIDEGASSIVALLAIPGADASTAFRMRAVEAAGNMSYYAGEPARAREMYRAQLELARALGDQKGVADARYNLLFTDYGPTDSAAASVELDAIAAAYRELGDDGAHARTMYAHGTHLMTIGRAKEAVEVLEEAFVRLRELGDLSYQAQATGQLSLLSFEGGDPQGGARWLLEGIAIAHEIGSVPLLTLALPVVATLMFHLGRPDAAATVLGAYEGLSRRIGVRAPELLEQFLRERDPTDQVRAAMDPAAYHEARERGSEMGIEEVFAYIMEVAGQPGAVAVGAPPQ